MTRLTAAPTSAAALLAVALLSGCGGAETPAPPAPPPPTSTRDAEPCSFLPQPVITTNGLKQVSSNKAQTSRSCSWTSAHFSMMVLVRWDQSTLVDFAQAFPTSVTNIDLDGATAVSGKSESRPACAAAVFPEQGTVMEIVVGDTPPSTTDSACARVKTIGAAVVHEVRAQHLFPGPTAAPATPTTS